MIADVIVAGAGWAGCIAAGLLVRRGLEVVLLARAAPEPSRAWPELVSPAAAARLDAVGALDGVASAGQLCLGILDSWNRLALDVTDFGLERCRLGWMVSRGEIDGPLLAWAAAQGARVVKGGSPRLVDGLYAETVSVATSGGAKSIVARFLLDATGWASSLMPPRYRARARFDGLVSVLVPLPPPRAERGWMRLSASSAGWWYRLTPGAGESAAVFVTDSDLLPRDPRDRESHLARELGEAFPEQGPAASTGPLIARDARTSIRTILWAGRWMPIGDAALCLDPIAGSGISRAIEMAGESAEVVARYLDSGDPGSLQAAAVERAQRMQADRARLVDTYAAGAEYRGMGCTPFWSRRLLRRPAVGVDNRLGGGAVAVEDASTGARTPPTPGWQD